MTTIEDTVKTAVAQALPSEPEVLIPPAKLVAPYIAANICKLLERVQVTGMESVAWCEAYQLMQQIAQAGGAPIGPQPAAVPTSGPGVPFNGLGK